MAQMPMGTPAESSDDAGEAQAPGGASEMVADIHSKLLNLADMVGQKFPEEQKELEGIIQAYQSFVDGLGQGPGAAKPGAPMPGTTTPEAGAADVRQAY